MVPGLYYLNNDPHNQHGSNSKINKQARALKQRIHTDSEKYDEQFRIGIEIEICLLDSESKTVIMKQQLNLHWKSYEKQILII